MRVTDPKKPGRVIELEEYLRLLSLAAHMPEKELPAPVSRYSRARVTRVRSTSPRHPCFAAWNSSTLTPGWIMLGMNLNGIVLCLSQAGWQ